MGLACSERALGHIYFGFKVVEIMETFEKNLETCSRNNPKPFPNMIDPLNFPGALLILIPIDSN